MPAVDPADFPKSELAALVAEAVVQVVFGYRNTPTDWEFRRLPLHGGLQEDFRAWAEDEAIYLRDKLTGRPYDPQWQGVESEYLYLSNDPSVGGNFFEQLPQFAEFPDFQNRKRTRKPNAWVIVAQLSDDSLAYFGSAITARSVLERSSKVLRIVYRDDAFDELDDTVITFGDGVDWIEWQSALVVLDKKGFESVFRDIPALEAAVEGNLAIVTKTVGIKNLDLLVERIKRSPGMMTKLQGILDRADMHTKPVGELRKYAEDYNIEIQWDGDEMVFDPSLNNQWNILRLLDEARTLGPVTGKHWDTSSKVEV